MRPETYQIKVRGLLNSRYSAWFENFEMTPTAEGDTLFTGVIADVAVLYGVVMRCRDLGVELISIHALTEHTHT